MKVKILSDFRDKYDYSRLYKAGDVITLNEERRNELIALGLVEPFNKKEDTTEEEKEDTTEEEKEDTTGKGRKTKDA